MAIYQTEIQDGNCTVLVQTDGNTKAEAIRKIVRMLQKHEFKVSKLEVRRLDHE